MEGERGRTYVGGTDEEVGIHLENHLAVWFYFHRDVVEGGIVVTDLLWGIVFGVFFDGAICSCVGDEG